MASQWKNSSRSYPKLSVEFYFKSGARTHRLGGDFWRTVQDSNPRLRLRRPEGYPDYPNGPRFLPAWPTHIQCAGWQSTTSLDRLLWTLTGEAMETVHPVSRILFFIMAHPMPITWISSDKGPSRASGLDGSIVQMVPPGHILPADDNAPRNLSLIHISEPTRPY